MDAPEAWAITTGNANIVVALLDDGVESYGYDIPSTKLQILNGSNFGTGNENDPSPQNGNNHGQSCAGIIIAQHNNYGIRGIAPSCTLMPVRNGNLGVEADVANAIKFAYQQGADVLSCSWHCYEYPLITAALDSALTYGRNGKGAVICFAAGNNANHDSQRNGGTEFPARLCATRTGLLSIGASTKDDLSANYSPWQIYPWISVVAPSNEYISVGEVWTTDRAYGGYNPNGSNYLPDIGYNYPAYTGRFSGTSAACPLVAGIAALVLSVNSNLEAYEVVNIIRDTAEQVGNYSYHHDSGSRSEEMGHGRVNAHLAVVAAQSANKPAVIQRQSRSMVIAPTLSISPNPANPMTTIAYTLPNARNVSLTVYSISGQKVATLADGFMEAGSHSAVFDGAGLASGVYIYHFRTQGFNKTGKIMLVK